MKTVHMCTPWEKCGGEAEVRRGEGKMDKLLYIGGEWTGASLPKMSVENPATKEVVGTVPRGGKEETKLAIDAASRALPAWSSLSAYDRSAVLEKWHDLMLEEEDEIAALITKEMGKPFKEAKGEVKYAASFLKWFAENGFQ